MRLVFNKKTILKNFCLLLFSLAMCLLLLEVIARVALGSEASYIMCAFISDPVVGWRLKPNIQLWETASSGEYSKLIETNSRGERSSEINVSGDKFLVIGLGDSFTFGAGVDENQIYLRVLEKKLRERGKNVNVLNAGVSNYNTKQELDMLELYLHDFDANLAIVGFFTGNDVYGNLEDSFRYDVVENCLKSKPPVEDEAKSISSVVRNFFRSNFKFYGFFAEKLRSVPVLREILMGLGLMQGKRPPTYILSLQNPPDQVMMQEAWDETERQFARAQEIGESHNIRIIILDIPSNFQISDELMKSALNTYGIPEQGFEFDYPETRLEKFLEDKPSLVFIPVLHEFRQSSEDLYYSNDPHWTAAGHDLAAQILERELVERGLV